MEHLTSDKQSIYNHPLFPLLAMLFDKCEMATADIEKVMSTAAFNREMDTFARDMERNRKAAVSDTLGVVTDNPELDSMMTNALQVLRIHLLELEKVNELCLDFCQRYVSCIKTKLSSHVLLKGDDSDSDDDFDLGLCPPPEPSQSHCDSASTSAQVSAGASATTQELSTSPSKLFYQMVQTSSGLAAQQVNTLTNVIAEPSSTDNSPMVQGSTPFSRIGGSHFPALKSHEKSVAEWNKSGAKRGVLPKHATQIMKSWLFQHIVHPYPTEEEKKRLSTQTNLSILQVNNWFINARRRIIQPMLDGSAGEQSKSRKNKPQVRQAQRFWPFPTGERNIGATAEGGELEDSGSLDTIDVTHDDEMSGSLLSTINQTPEEESSKSTVESGEINPI